MYFGKALTGAAIAVAASVTVASATTVPISQIVANEAYTHTEVLPVGGELTFSLSFDQDVTIPVFAVAATGNNGAEDVSEITFGFDRNALDTFSFITDFGGSAGAMDAVPGGTFLAGTTAEIIFVDGINDAVGISISFMTEEVAPIPLPASGLLLGGALLGAMGLKRKRRKTA